MKRLPVVVDPAPAAAAAVVATGAGKEGCSGVRVVARVVSARGTVAGMEGAAAPSSDGKVVYVEVCHSPMDKRPVVV